jgi:hypothetical protein
VSLVCDSVAPFWTLDALSGSLHWPKRSLAAGPLRFATKAHPHMNPAPPRVPHCLLSRPTCRPDQLPGFCAPSTTPLGQAPHGVDRPRPLPVPLSGFLNLSAVSQQVRVSRPCFMPQPLGILPSEVSPRRNRAPLPGPLLLPCGYPPACRTATAPALSPSVSSTSALLTQLPISPDDYGLPFHAPESALPGPPGLERRNPSCSASFTRFEALILLRIRSHRTRVAPSEAAVPLLGFSPSRVFSAQTSDPPPTQT